MRPHLARHSGKRRDSRQQNERHFARYRFVLEAGEHYLDEVTGKSMGSNHLSEEIAERIVVVPIRFDWYAQLAGSGDKIEDPSIAWPGPEPW